MSAARSDVNDWLRAAIAPVPTPSGLTSRELVVQAIELQSPARIPYSFVEPHASDFFEIAELERQLERATPRLLGSEYVDPWGVRREVAEGLFDRVLDHPLADLSGLSSHVFPTANELTDLDRLAPFVDEAHMAGKYIVAADPVLLFERARDLMGFEPMLLAPRTDRSKYLELVEILTSLTVESIDRYRDLEHVDSFMSWQDFGTQTGLMISLKDFREFYKPGLQRVVQAAHDRGMTYILHCCGLITELIPDLVEIGVDVLQLDQPKLIGHDELRAGFGGKICFWNAVDTLWATQRARTEAAIEAEVRAMRAPFEDLPGGFMARHYPQHEDINLPENFHGITRRAFLGLEDGADTPS